MNQEPLISVIVPVYNVEAYLRQCIDSVLCQTYEKLEILLVDDGSKDSGGAICDEYAGKDSRVRVIHKENGGLSSARNAGIAAAQGEYLAFLDSDDWVEPDAYGSMLEAALTMDCRLVCAGRYVYSEKKQQRREELCPEKTQVLSAEDMLGKLFTWEGCDSAAWDKLYHRSLFETGIRYPEGMHYEDIPTTYLLVERAEKVAMLAKRVYNYRHRIGSITMAPFTERTFHMEQHTKVVYDHIASCYPAIEPQVRFLRVRSLRFSVLTAELSDPASRKPFEKQIRESRKALRSHWRFILSSPLFSRLERQQDLTLAFGLYGPIHRLRHGA